MAKSIYEILDDLTTNTSVPGHGKEVEHSLPRNLFPTAQQFENEDELLAWAQQNGIIHAVLQKGIQKFLIECRAVFKFCKKDDTWSIEYGQKNVDAMEWKITERPNQSGGKAAAQTRLEAGIEMARAMKKAKLAEKTILAALVPVYGEDGATAILAAITEK